MGTGTASLAFIPSTYIYFLRPSKLNPTSRLNLLTKSPEMEIGGVGASLNIFIFLWYDKFLREGKERKATWALNEEYRRLPLACIAAPLYTIALFWLVSSFSHAPMLLLFANELNLGMVSQTRCPPDRAHALRGSLGHGDGAHIHEFTQLSYRRLRCVFGLCPSRCWIFAQSGGSLVPLGWRPALPSIRNSLGYKSTWIRLPFSWSLSVLAAVLRPQATGKKSVLSILVGTKTTRKHSVNALRNGPVLFVSSCLLV